MSRSRQGCNQLRKAQNQTTAFAPISDSVLVMIAKQFHLLASGGIQIPPADPAVERRES